MAKRELSKRGDEVSQICPDQERLAGFVQGLLSQTENSELENHLQQCDACGGTVRELHASDTVLNFVRTLEIPDEPPPEDEPIIASLLNELRELPAKTAALTSASVPTSSSERDVSLRVDEVLRLASSAASDDELGRLAHYRLLRLLGVGGMGVVFEAEDTKLQRLVALKVMQPSRGEKARDRFVREARAAAAIQHDNVITIYDVGLEGPLAYLAMQSLDGETLDQCLQREGSLPPEEVRRIAADVAEGLAAAHAKKLVHRDIKPANVWLEAKLGRAVILDFGLARVADADSELTETGMIAGTPAYMSPEQAQGRPVDTRTDLFSLGSMMYRMLTGSIPFPAANALATIRAIQNDQPKRVGDLAPTVPTEMAQTVNRLMTKDVARRVASATEAAAALRTRRVAQAPPNENDTCEKSARSATSSRFGRSGAALTVALLFAMAGWFAVPMVYRIATNQGVFEINTHDPDVKVEVMQGDQQVAILDGDHNRITIAAGKYELQLMDKTSHAIVSPDEVTLRRNDVAVVTVKRLTGEKGQDTLPAGAQPVPNQPPRRIAGAPGPSPPTHADLVKAIEKSYHGSFDFGSLQSKTELEKLHGIPGLIAVLGEHPEGVWGLPRRLSLTPDESKVYLVSSNGYVVVHDTQTLALVDRFRAHEQRCLDVVVMDKGRKLVTICIDGMVRLWDITEKEPRQLHEVLLVDPEAESHWLDMQVASNGLMVIRSSDGVYLVRISGDRLHEAALPELSEKTPWEFALSPDGKWLVTCVKAKSFTTERVGRGTYSHYDASLVLWDLAGDEPDVVDDYECKDMINLVLHKNSNGEYVLEADDQDFAPEAQHRTWRIKKHGELKLASHSPHRPRSFAKPQRNGSANLLARPSEQELVIESDNEGSVNPVLQTGAITAVTFLDDDSVIVAKSTLLQRWNRTAEGYQPQPQSDVVLHEKPVTQVHFDRHTDSLVSSSADRSIAWEFPSLAPTPVFALNENRVSQLTDRLYLLLHKDGGRQRLTGVRRTESNGLVEAFEIDFGGREQNSIWSASMHPVRDIVATGYWNGNICVWDASASEPVALATWSGKGGHVCDVKFSPDGKQLVAALWNGTVKSWDWAACTEKGKSVGSKTICRHDDTARTVAFSRDGAYLASGGEDGQIFVHRFEDGEQSVMSQDPVGDTNTVGSLEFSNDRTELLSADGNGRVTVWAMPACEVQKTWQLPGWVWSARFSPDNKVIATGNQNGSVYLLRK